MAFVIDAPYPYQLEETMDASSEEEFGVQLRNSSFWTAVSEVLVNQPGRVPDQVARDLQAYCALEALLLAKVAQILHDLGFVDRQEVDRVESLVDLRPGDIDQAFALLRR